MRTNLPTEQVHALLSVPHQIYLVNNILSSKIEAFKSQITFGNINPAGDVITAVSIDVSTSDLYSIAKDIVELIDSSKDKFNEEYIKFLNSK